MNIKPVNLLDCTLRDGGYYNNWDFSKTVIQNYINDICSTGIKNIELGFRFKEIKKIKGLTAYTDQNLLKYLKIPKNINLGIMINTSDLIENNSLKVQVLENLISKQNKKKLSFVRFACHYNEIFYLERCFKYLEKLDLKVFINIMQISEIKFQQLDKIADFLKKNKVKTIYLADSLGALKPNKLKNIILHLKKKWNWEIGLHAHNNLCLALNNSLTAINNGVQWIDATVTGMGRGPGNLRTEDIIRHCNDYTITKKFKNLKSYFLKLKKNYKRGPNKYYNFAAKKKIHPTYIQKILTDKRYTKKEYNKILKSLSKSDTKKFNPYKLINSIYFITNKFKGNWSPKKIIKNQNVVILGPGKNLKQNKKKIEKKIINENNFVISLNTFPTIRENLINLRVSCHPLRIMSDKTKFNKLNCPLVIPYSSLQSKLKKSISLRRNFYDYGISLQNNNQIIVNNNYCILPYPLAIGYAISIALAGKAKTIRLAGFDGYDKSDPDNDNTEELFKFFINKYFKKKIVSLTKTKFKSLSYEVI